MSFGFQNLRSDPIDKHEFQSPVNSYGVQDPFVSGLTSTRKAIGSTHPLEVSQKQHFQNELSLEMTMLRNNQGLHAPMRLAMELKCADKIGRHPFLPSSSVMRDVILGREEHIGPEDIFNIAEFREQMGQPHAVVEKSLGLL